MKIQKVHVVGGGAMGSGIAQLCAQQGFEVTLSDVSIELAEKCRAGIARALGARVEKGKLTGEERDRILAKIEAAGDLGSARHADIVIETVVEKLEVKRAVFKELDGLVRDGVVILTNTTSLSITAMAAATRRPDKVAQMHFFNPPVIMKLVEIMPGQKTSPETLQTAVNFAKELGKEPVLCRTEAPAGIVSRALGQLLNEATWMVQSGIAEPRDVDTSMKLGANHPMGPLELIDLIGLDVHRAKMQTLRAALDDSRYDHPQIIDQMIAEGRLGKKAGRGFYDYRSK
jgi:3-hydroxybutyryl-CoA dehydrogenase